MQKPAHAKPVGISGHPHAAKGEFKKPIHAHPTKPHANGSKPVGQKISAHAPKRNDSLPVKAASKSFRKTSTAAKTTGAPKTIGQTVKSIFKKVFG